MRLLRPPTPCSSVENQNFAFTTDNVTLIPPPPNTSWCNPAEQIPGSFFTGREKNMVGLADLAAPPRFGCTNEHDKSHLAKVCQRTVYIFGKCRRGLQVLQRPGTPSFHIAHFNSNVYIL